jgi:hypothetical protein
MADTLNICLGHQPFPEEYASHVDIFLTCRRLYGQNRAIYVDDAIWGPHGGALSEYAQLFWLCDNFDHVVGDTPYVRIFQYRRFVSQNRIGREANVAYISLVSREDLPAFADDFARDMNAELFNRPFQFDGGMLGQFAFGHPLDDLLAVIRFLLQRERITPPAATAFLREEYLIPACNMGVFRRETLKHILALLRPVADFLQSPDFVAREGYNRRSPGFILERLNSFILLDMMRNGQAPQNFGNHIVISEPETSDVGVTIAI